MVFCESWGEGVIGGRAMRATRYLGIALFLLVVGCSKKAPPGAAPGPSPSSPEVASVEPTPSKPAGEVGGKTPAEKEPSRFRFRFPALTPPPPAGEASPAVPHERPTAVNPWVEAGVTTGLVGLGEKEAPKGAPPEDRAVAAEPVVKGPPDPPEPPPSSASKTPPPTKPPSDFGGKTLAEWMKDLTNGDASVRVDAILAIPHFGDASADA